MAFGFSTERSPARRPLRRKLAWLRRTLVMVAVTGGLGLTACCAAQLCLNSHSTDLYCLLPAAFHTQASPAFNAFNAFFAPFGAELSELPTARPGGLTLTFDHGMLVPANESLGGLFTERAETVGRHHIFLGFDYQNFRFGTIDGQNMKYLPIVLYYPPQQVYTATTNRLDLRAGQYTAVIAAGLTTRLDLSVAVPLERVSMKANVQGSEYGPGGAAASFSEYVPGHSSGFSDVVVGVKGLLLQRGSFRLGAGADVRIPTGDELNFLGAGTVGVRPYLVISRRARVSPHLNTGYQWNGDSILNASSTGAKQQLPTNFFYTAGVNLEAGKHCTVVADILGRTVFNAPRLATPTGVPGFGLAPSVQPYYGTYNTTDASFGMKAETFAHLVVTGNVTMQLDSGGLRARAVPLIGIARSF
jgi:hypothetical protein